MRKWKKNLKIENTKKELVTRFEEQIRYGHDKILEYVPSARKPGAAKVRSFNNLDILLLKNQHLYSMSSLS